MQGNGGIENVEEQKIADLERKPGKEGSVMNELNEVVDLFKSSSFYMKYRDTYFCI